MAADGTIKIYTDVDTKGIASGTRRIESSMSKLGGTIKKIGGMIATAFAVQKVVQFGKECLELGSDLQEVQNVVDSVFATMSDKVDEFAKNAAVTAGLSETMAKKYTGTFGAMAKSFGFTEGQALDMSTALTQLSGDVASFYNLTQDEAYTKLKSVFTGETESLKELGVVMTQAALDEYALANGYGKTTAAMTEQEKVALRYKFVMSQLSTASGDFIRTSDGWANQVRILKLQFESLKATIGQGLINIFTPVLRVINILLAKLATVANAFKSFTELITGKQSSGSTGATSAGLTDTGLSNVGEDYNDAAAGAQNLADATENAADATKDARKEAEGYLSPIDTINKLAKEDNFSDAAPESSGRGSASPLENAVGNVDYGKLAEGETVLEKTNGSMDNLIKRFKELKKAIQPTIDSLKRLWNEGLARLGNFAWTALKDFYKGFLVPVGKWVFGEGLPRFIDALNNGLMKVDFQKINEALKRLWDALAPFAIHVGEGLLWLWENVLVPFGTWTANEIVPRFLDTLSISIGAVNKVIEALKPLFEWFWESVLKPIAEWTGDLFLEAWDGINNALQKFSDWCGKHPEAIQNIAVIIASFFAAWKISSFISAAAGFIGTITNIFGSIKSLAGVFSLVKTGIGAVVGALGGPLTIAIGVAIAAGILLYKNWDKVCEKCAKMRDWVVEKTRSLKDGAVKAFDTLKTNVSNATSVLVSSVKNKWNALKNWLSSTWNTIKNTASSTWGTIKNKIVGFADAISDKVHDIFSGMRDKIAAVFEGIVDFIKQPLNKAIEFANNAISMINGALGGLENALSFGPWDIPTPFGTKTIGFSVSMPRVSELPYLAQGAVIPPNAPFAAVLGDQRSGNNLEAPESLIRKIVREESGGNNVYKIPVTISGRQLMEIVIDEATLKQARSGKNPLVTLGGT